MWISCHTDSVVNRDELESHIMQLWVTTQIPLTVANLQFSSKVPRRKLVTWLRALQEQGIIALKSNNGDFAVLVPGAERSRDGCRSFEELALLERVRGQAKAEMARRKQAKVQANADMVARKQAKNSQALETLESGGQTTTTDIVESRLEVANTALELASAAKQELTRPKNPKDKSLLLSGALSGFLGPLGWLYAGSLREAVPASIAFVVAVTVIGSILPSAFLLPLMTVGLPLSGIAGLVYAWQHNRNGERSRLFNKED